MLIEELTMTKDDFFTFDLYFLESTLTLQVQLASPMPELLRVNIISKPERLRVPSAVFNMERGVRKTFSHAQLWPFEIINGR